MNEPREPREVPHVEISLPKQVWDKYRYLTLYAAAVSTLLLLLQLKG